MTVEPLRVAFRRQVRDHALDVAHRMTVDVGWEQVRVGSIAEQAGVSRPTIYREFGDKEGLGEALVMREVERFLEGITATLNAHATDIGAAVGAAVRFTLDEAGRNPLLHAVLTASRAGSTSLLPFLTSRSGPLLSVATAVLSSWFAEHHPEYEDRVLAEALDAVVRLMVSYLVLPASTPDETATVIARIATRYLGVPDPA